MNQQPYRERLWPGFGMFLAVTLIIPATSLVAMPLLQRAELSLWWAAPVSLVVYGLCVIWLRLMSPLISVSEGKLRAGVAQIKTGWLGRAEVFTGGAAREQLGPQLDARSYRMTRGWVKNLVRIELSDPRDPTPYWLISTRHPEKLIAAIAGKSASYRNLDRLAPEDPARPTATGA